MSHERQINELDKLIDQINDRRVLIELGRNAHLCKSSFLEVLRNRVQLQLDSKDQHSPRTGGEARKR